MEPIPKFGERAAEKPCLDIRNDVDRPGNGAGRALLPDHGLPDPGDHYIHPFIALDRVTGHRLVVQPSAGPARIEFKCRTGRFPPATGAKDMVIF